MGQRHLRPALRAWLDGQGGGLQVVAAVQTKMLPFIIRGLTVLTNRHLNLLADNHSGLRSGRIGVRAWIALNSITHHDPEAIEPNALK